MAIVVQIAPLINLPCGSDVFDYSWELPVAPSHGMIVSVRFRRRETRGVVVGIRDNSNFRLTPLAAQEPLLLLSAVDVEFARQLASRMRAGIGSLFIHMLPPLGERTIQQLTPCTRAGACVRRARTGSRSYAWIRNMDAAPEALARVIAQHHDADKIIVVTASHETTKQIVAGLSALTRSHAVLELSSERSAPERRTIWNAWHDAAQPCIIVGTHLAAWLPSHGRTLCIIIEPSHPHHEQWDGPVYHNRQILEARRLIMGDRVVAIGHSPARIDFDHTKNMPQLKEWPTILDRTSDEPRQRSFMFSPQLDEVVTSQRRVLFFVPHLKKNTHELCRDCASLYDTKDAATQTRCKKCGGTTFVSLGAGGLQLQSELFERNLLGADEKPALIDIKNFDPAGLAKARIVIATGPLFDRIAYDSFDCIVDLTTDFELLHPEFDSLERLWLRLRAMSARLGAQWHGSWFVETRSPHLSAWALQSPEGFSTWWNDEKILRKRFGQSPYTPLDFFNFS